MSILFKRIFSIVALVAMFATTVSVQAGTFEMNPSSKEFVEGCHSNVDIMIDTQGKTSNAADIELKYNPAQIEIIDGDAGLPGKQIKTGNAYEVYVGNQVDESIGMIRLAGMSLVVPFNGKAKFATVQFKAKEGVVATDIDIRFTGVGDTLDSNIAEFSTSDDILTGVSNGSFTFRTGPCFPDRKKPSIGFDNPNGSSDTAADIEAGGGKVIVRIGDSGDGVDLSTVVIIINGEEYLPTDPDVIVEGDKSGYTFKIGLRNPLPEDTSSIIKARATDFAGNKASRTLVFNYPADIPPPIEPCPECDCPETESEKNLINIINNSVITESILESPVVQNFMEATGGMAFPIIFLIFLIIGMILGWLLRSWLMRMWKAATSKKKEEDTKKTQKKKSK